MSEASPRLTSVPAHTGSPVDSGRSRLLASLVLVLVGVVAGTGQLWGGLYSVAVWGPISIVLLALVVVALIVTDTRPSGAAAILLAALVGLALWCAVSQLWADAPRLAALEAQRWALYAALTAIVALLVRDDRDRQMVLGSAAASTVCVVVGIAVRLTAGHPQSLFFGMRLFEPIGYANGQATECLFAFWVCAAVAERARRAPVRAAGLAGAAVATGLLMLTQSRGGFLALGLSLLVMVAVFDGRQRRIWMLVVLGVALVICARPLLHVYTSTPSPQLRPSTSTVRAAMARLWLSAAAAGLGWAAVSAAFDQLGEARRRLAAPIGATAIGCLGVAAVVALLAAGVPGKVRHQLREFTSLDRSTALTTQTRLLSGYGNRYDYWRVALHELADRPVGGEGAGNYTRDYFRLRDTDEDVRQPHSLALQSAAELGIVGLVLVLVLVAAAAAAIVRAAATVANRAREPIGAIAAAGIAVCWLGQTNIDWIHLLPSVTAVALVAIVTLARGSRPWASPQRRVPVVSAVLVAAVLAASGVARLTLASHAQSQASKLLAGNPARAIQEARRSVDLGGASVDAQVVMSAAYASLGNYAAAVAALDTAARHEPRNPIPPLLLGDLATRRGLTEQATRLYERAARLNPRDPAIRAAVARVRSAPR